jgi:hypothetical protein
MLHTTGSQVAKANPCPAVTHSSMLVGGALQPWRYAKSGRLGRGAGDAEGGVCFRCETEGMSAARAV